MKKIIPIMILITILGCGGEREKAPELPQQIASPTPIPVESQEQYVSLCKFVGTKKAPIFYKDFMKNPDKYKGARVHIYGKILEISEKDKVTRINLLISYHRDVVLIYYEGSAEVFKGDFVTIYGECLGKRYSKNQMGADHAWPLIKAQYIKKGKDLKK